MGCCDGKRSKTFTQYSIVKAGKSLIKNFIDPTYNAFVDPQTKKTRLDACRKCEMLETFFNKERCKVCLCFIEPKSSLVDQSCPHPEIDKWQRKEESQ